MHVRLAVPLVLVLLLAACSEQSGADPTVTTTPAAVQETEAALPELGEGVTVVTTVFAPASIARDIAPGADVTLLTSSGQDPHDLELSPADRAAIEGADIVIYMGDLDFQPQVESAIDAATGEVVSVADVAGAGNLLDLDDHSHDEGDDHGEADAVDPHIWFDAAIMAEVAEAVGEAFAAFDTDNADEYRASADALHDELLTLDDELDELLSDCAFDTAIVSHEAYAYLLEPRDLAQEGISGAGGHGEASPQRLADLTERIRGEGSPAVLAEPFEGRADAEALAAEAGVDLLEINPLEIGSDDLLALGYAEALRAQAATFAEALECD